MGNSRRRGRSLFGWCIAGSCILGGAEPAAGQDYLFSLSGTGDGPFGTLEDQEIGVYRSAQGTVAPWLRTCSGAFFSGDLSGAGRSEEWNDVDAWCVRSDEGGSVREVYLSLLSNLASYQDGDILALSPTGTMEVFAAESQFVAAFGATDGNVDVDAFHRGADGTWWLSFAEDEESSILDTDQPGVITDGSILWWNTATATVGVLLDESGVDQAVSMALGRSVKSGDVTGLSISSRGFLDFCVQSPSDHDATIFSLEGGGSVWVEEVQLGFGNSVEMNALAAVAEGVEFLTSHVADRTISVGEPLLLELWGPPRREFLVLLSAARGDASAFAGEGFSGLFLSPVDPFFSFSLSAGLSGVTDAGGYGTMGFPVAPAGFSLILLGQPYDLATGHFGTPFAADFEG